MARKRKAVEPLPTIWRVPDELWDIVQGIISKNDPAPLKGRPRIDPREALDAIIYRMRTGVQWNHLPDCFPDDSSVHRTFQRWIRLDLMDRIWSVIIDRCDELGGVDCLGSQFNWNLRTGFCERLRCRYAAA